jgi:hypothetical protein
MSSNRIPRNYEPLVVFLEHALAGARQHGAEIGLKQNDESSLAAVLANLIGIGSGADAAAGHMGRWNNAKSAKTAATGALRAAENQGRALVSACLGILKPRLGNQWNAAWQEVGFTGASLQVPTHPLVLLRHLQQYFAAHPDYEIANLTAQISCTAAACGAAADAITAAGAASRQSNLDAGVSKQALEQSLQAARARLSGLRAELNQLMADDDPRWFVFGFDPPGSISSPEIPAHLVLTPGPAGTLFADWDDAPRADNYRATVSDADGKALAERLVAKARRCSADCLPARKSPLSSPRGMRAGKARHRRRWKRPWFDNERFRGSGF